MFKKSKTDNYYLYGTEVDNLFISEFMTDAPGNYVKAYLLGLMYASTGMRMDREAIMRRLGMSTDEMEDCFSYWEERGVIRRVTDKDDPNGRYDVEFINLRELAFGGRKEIRKESPLDDKALRKLYHDVQAATGRMLGASEMRTIASLLSEYGIDPELIVYCYSYCTANRKSNSERYVAKVLKDWKQKGFETVAQAASYLDESDARNQDYRDIFKELGFFRNPTAEERRTMAAWFAKGFSLDDIKEACKKTVGISSPSIKYVDAVLNKTKEEKEGGKEGGEKQENLAVLIQRLYEKTREENAKKTEENRMKVFTKHPEILKIETEFKSAMLDLTSAMIRKDAAKIEQIDLKLKGLEAEKAKALSLGGYPENMLDQIYTCSKCKDTGMLEDGNTCSCYYEKMQAVKQESK